MIKVYGASDDLIEIDGDIREEFNTDEGILLFSDGTMLEVRFNAFSQWRIDVLQEGQAHVHYASKLGLLDDDGGTEVVHLIGGDIKFVAFVDSLVWAS